MDKIIDVVKKRFKSLNYTVKDGDDWLLNFLTEKVSDHIENACNINDLPDNLFFFAVDMICAEFLSNKRAIGELEESDVESTVKSIKEGDTTVTFAIADGADSLESLISGMKADLDKQLVKFRRLSW